MTDRKLRFHQALARITRVKDQQAAAALAQALVAEKQCDAAHQQALDARSAVESERDRCLDAGAGVDMARYSLLGSLGDACEQRVDRAVDACEAAVAARQACSETRLHTKHRWKRADEEADRYRLELAMQLHEKRMEDGIELWLQGRERE